MPRGGQHVAAAAGTAVAYPGSLLAHGLAHSLVARARPQAGGITLWLLGGVSRLQGEVPDPGAEVRVAGVGLLVSLVLGGAFWLLAWLLHGLGVRGVVVAALAWLGASPGTGSRPLSGLPGPGRLSVGPSLRWGAFLWSWPGGITAGCGSSFLAGS